MAAPRTDGPGRAVQLEGPTAEGLGVTGRALSQELPPRAGELKLFGQA